jgi:membrane associated rhomboid family serine protease
MDVKRELGKAVLAFVVFVAIWLIINLITGNGLSGQAVTSAVITGLIFTVIYSVSIYFYQKRKLKN